MNGKRALAGIILVAVVTLGACESAEMVEANEQIARARADLAQFVKAINQPPPDGVPVDEQAEKAKATIAEFMADADKAIGIGQAVLQAAAENEDPGVAIREAGTAVASGLPAQYGVWVFLATSIAGAFGSAFYKRSSSRTQGQLAVTRAAAQSIGRAIELVKNARTPSGVVDFNDQATKNTLRATMGAEAIKLVDEGRGKA